jgi:hypothetical protein
MSYRINTTDGRLLVDLIDGKIDSSTTDLNLIGKNVSGFGEFLNENFVRLAENFSSSSPPSSPLKGQLWYDTTEERLKIYDGSQFKPTDTTIVSATNPGLTSGGIWIDSSNRQLYFSDGTATVLAGPIYSVLQGETGFKVETVTDVSGNPKVIAKLMIGSIPVALISRESFTPSIQQTGFTGNILTGINIASNFSDSFKFYGEASSASSLKDNLGNVFSASDFLKATQNNTLTGTLYVKNNGGIRFGGNGEHLLRVAGNTVFAQNTLLNYNYSIQVTKSSGVTDAIYVNAANSRVGIFRNTPAYTLDVNGDLRVTGNLVVEGTSTSLQVSTVEVEDKNIEIAKASVLLSNADLDGAGIVIKSSSSDKTILWENTGSNIAVSENLKIASGKVYKIGTDTVLSTTEIGTTVVSALGLTQIGTLQYLDVDNINLNNNTISVSGSGLQIDSAGDINVVNNNKIVNLGNPTDPQDAATKFYVDSTIEAYPISLALDITGLNDTQIGLVINDVAPATLYDNGKTARIHTFYYSGVSVIRGLKLYTVSGGNWVFTQNLVSSV